MLKVFNHTVGHQELLYQIDNLEINAGEFVALIGANGTGKSTFFNDLVSGNFVDNSTSLQEQSLAKLNLQERAKRITLVDNHFLGLSHLPVYEYLKLGRYTYTNLLNQLTENDQQIIQKYVDLLKLNNLLNRATSTLSDGERQRVSIAKALIQETPLILLDEPTAFLDYPTKKEVMITLAEIANTQNRIVLLASHDIDFCLAYCNRFLLIEKQTKKLQSFSQITKEELLSIAFQ